MIVDGGWEETDTEWKSNCLEKRNAGAERRPRFAV
jgi:hypothetical protein